VQLEGQSQWHPIRNFVQGYDLDDPGLPALSGVRVSQFRGKPALEYSDDGTPTYYKLNDTFTIPATIAGLPASPLPTIKWTSAAQVVNESATKLTITATLDRAATQDVDAAVYFRGSALPGVDFVSPSPDSDTATVLTIPVGGIQRSLMVSLKRNPDQMDHTLTFYLERVAGARIGEQPTQTVSIKNIDLPTSSTPAPDNSGALVFWKTVPSGVFTGVVPLEIHVPNFFSKVQLFVDGSMIDEVPCPVPGTQNFVHTFSVDTAGLSNGLHVFVAKGFLDTASSDSLPILRSVQN